MATYRLDLEYDGTGYQGFQRQGRRPTVQAALEAALERLTGEAITVVGAGRTDAGVHASGQVVSLALAREWAPARLRDGLNHYLPSDIAVRRAQRAPEGFHARFDAIERAYCYRVWNAPARSALWRDRAYHVAPPLDLARMQRASAAYIGEHDFAAYAASPHRGGAVRRIRVASWRQTGPLLSFRVVGNAFVTHQVRSMVGTVIRVGLGRAPEELPGELLKTGDRRAAGPTAPARGLCLTRVRYAGEAAAEAEEDETR